MCQRVCFRQDVFKALKDIQTAVTIKSKRVRREAQRSKYEGTVLRHANTTVPRHANITVPFRGMPTPRFFKKKNSKKRKGKINVEFPQKAEN